MRETIGEHLVQVQAMRQLLSETDFGNQPSKGFPLIWSNIANALFFSDAKCSRILAFIDPPEFMDDLELAQAVREEGTGLWLFHQPSLLKWITAPGENVLWVNGKQKYYKKFKAVRSRKA